MNSEACLSFNDDELTNVLIALSRLTLVNFRNYKYLRLNFNKPFIVFSGENGSGKTNILEAISFLSQGRGLRNAKLSEVKTFDFLSQTIDTPVYINNNGWAVSAQIQTMFDNYSIGTSVETIAKEVSFNEIKEMERRIIHVDNQKLSSQNELGNYISIIWVTPQMDRIFLSSAQTRRCFLDRIVYTFDTEHAKRISSYENLYRQWLQILKSGRPNIVWLESLEEKLASLGVAIAAARREQVTKLNAFIETNPDDIFPDAYLRLDGTIENMLSEEPAIFVEDFYKESLVKQRHNILNSESSSEIVKTDLCVLYKKKNVPASLCSTGEQKSLLLNIILAEAKLIKKIKGTPPILLLDEITAHLDDNKRDAFLYKINELQTQCFLTTTSLFEFMSIKDSTQFFEIKNNTAIKLDI